jgi:hypothetical protein
MREMLDVVALLVTGAALGGAAVSVAWWWDTVGRGRAFRRWLGRHGDFDATVPSGAAFLAEAHRRRQDERAARLKEAAR